MTWRELYAVPLGCPDCDGTIIVIRGLLWWCVRCWREGGA